MGRWTDIATWSGPSPNQGGAAVEQRGVVLHIAEGSYEGTVAWCMNATSSISAHFVSAKNGRAAQLVDTDRTAWTQSAGNGRWLSIEFEGRAGQSLSSEQAEFAARVLARAHREYGVPLTLADSPSDRGLGWHGMGGQAWGGHTGCPGAPIVAQRPAILARAQQIVNGGTDVFTPQQEASLVQTSEYINAWMDGRGSTWDGKPLRPAALATMSSDIAVIKARPAVQLTDAQLDLLSERVVAMVATQLAGVVEATLRKVLGQLDEAPGGE